MFRAPHRPQRSPGAPPPGGRHPSPNAGWGFPGARPPSSGHHERSPGGVPPYCTSSPSFSPGAGRGYRNGSPGSYGSGYRDFKESLTGFRGNPRNFGDSPAGFRGGRRGFGDSSGGSRGFGGHNRGRNEGHWRQHSFSPSTPNYKAGCSDVPVERYFSQSMLQDPWRNLQPVTHSEATARRTKGPSRHSESS